MLAEAESKVNSLQISQERHEALKQKIAEIDLDDPLLFYNDEPTDPSNKCNHCKEVSQLIAHRCKGSRVKRDAIFEAVMRKLDAGLKVITEAALKMVALLKMPR